MTENYWLSRRPKYTVEQIFRIGFEFVLEGRSEASFKPLELAAAGGHAEALWLMKHYETYPDNLVHNLFDRSSFSKHNSPRAMKYQLWFPGRLELDAEQRQLLGQLAEEGEAMCQHLLAEIHDDAREFKLAVAWYSKAAAQNFSRSVYRLAVLRGSMVLGSIYDKKESQRLLILAVKLAYPAALRDIQEAICKLDDSSVNFAINVVRYEARIRINDIVSSSTFLKTKLDEDRFDLNKTESRDAAVRLYYALGYEFDDYEKYHVLLRGSINDVVVPTVTVYQQITSKARRAVVQTILVLRSLRVCRDIAILIAKLVYNSRSEEDWYVDTPQK